jgi:hypothetical protein
MFRSNTIRSLFFSVFVLAVTVSALPDIRIKFARGRTSATMTGKISNGGRICYFAGAKRGQTLTATISSSTGKVQIFESGDTSYTSEIEYSGDQSVCVDNLGRAASYSLTVSIR